MKKRFALRHGPGYAPWQLAGVLIALVVCAAAQWHFRSRTLWTDPSQLQQADFADLLMIASAALVAVLLGRPSVAVPPRLEAPAPILGRPWPATLGAVVALAGCGVFGYAVWLLWSSWGRSFDFAAPLAVAGVAVWSAGLALLDRVWRPRTAGQPWSRWEWWLLVGVTAVGIFMRFYRYDYYPPDGVCAVEEPQAGQVTYAIIQHGARPWEFVGDRWLPVPFFKLMGETLTAVRLPFTMMSALTVPALYLLLRQLVSWPVALWSTFLFAVCSWHLLYARLAHNIFATTLIVIIVFAMCLHAHRRGGLVWYPWIGFLTGYTLYTYAGYRGTLLFVGLFLAISFWLHVRAWRRALLPWALAHARRIVTLQSVGLVLAALAFAGPLIVLVPQVRAKPEYYVEAANRSLLNKDYYTDDLGSFVRQRFDRLRKTAMIFNHLGDGSETFNFPNAPMLDPVTALLAFVGLLYCVVWWRYRWQGYFAFVFLLLLVLGTTFVQNLDIRRLQGIIPLIFVLVAFAADRFRDLVSGQVGPRSRVPLAALALLIAGATLLINYDHFYGRTIQDRRVRASFQNPYTVLVRYLQTVPDDSYIVLAGRTTNFFRPSDFEWLRGSRVPGEFTLDLLPLFRGDTGPWSDRQLIVLLEHPLEREALARLLEERLSGTSCRIVQHPDAPARDFTACTVGQLAGDTVASSGVLARYFRGDQTEPFLVRVEPTISFAFTPSACREPAAHGHPPCRVEWTGTWEIAQDGAYDVLAEADGGTVQATIDGQRAGSGMRLSAGPHLVQVKAHYQRIEAIGTRVLWGTAGSASRDLLRFGAPPAAAPEG